MEKENTGGARKSSVEFEFLEDWVRENVQRYIKFLLEQARPKSFSAGKSGTERELWIPRRGIATGTERADT